MTAVLASKDIVLEFWLTMPKDSPPPLQLTEVGSGLSETRGFCYDCHVVSTSWGLSPPPLATNNGVFKITEACLRQVYGAKRPSLSCDVLVPHLRIELSEELDAPPGLQPGPSP